MEVSLGEAKDLTGLPNAPTALATPNQATPIEAAPEISEGTESGWTVVARSVQEIDHEKIKGYKEDIDSILVFVSMIIVVIVSASHLMWPSSGRSIFRGPLCTSRRVLSVLTARPEYHRHLSTITSRCSDSQLYNQWRFPQLYC